MARPGFIAALLLPLPFAALPLVAVLLGGPSVTGNENVVYAPISTSVRLEDKPASVAAHTDYTARLADEYKHGCDDLASES